MFTLLKSFHFCSHSYTYGYTYMITKAIKILTKYSHVLSFKKIQERTVEMMADLRVKVGVYVVYV